MRNLIIITVLYFYIYNPVFTCLGFGLVNVLIVLSLIYTILKWRTVRLYLKSYKIEFVLSFLMLIYVTSICAINGTEQQGTNIALWIVSTVFVPVFLIEQFFHGNKSFVFFDLIILVGFIASLFSCTALFYPPFNSFLRSIQVTREFTDFAEMQFSFRYFGLAINLSNAYGYVQGLLASLCLLRLNKTRKRYIIYFFTFIISVVVNARTGLFPIFLTLVYLLTKSFLKFDVWTMSKIASGSTVIIVLIMYLLSINSEVEAFFFDFFTQISDLLFSNDSGIEDSVYYTMIRFPETTIGFIFGEGRSLFNEETFENSDIGYVNQLFIGGIIFVSMLLMYEYCLYYRIKQRSKEIVFSTIFFISILVFNYKGVNFYTSCSFVKLWMLYYFVLVHNRIHTNKIAIY